MALSATYRFVPNAALTHWSGCQYQTNAAGILTIPAADAFTWLSGPLPPDQLARGVNLYSPSGLLTTNTSGLLVSTAPANSVLVFLFWQGLTADRPTATGGSFPELGPGQIYLDTSLSKFVFYVKPGQSVSPVGGVAPTAWLDQLGNWV